MTNLKKIGVIGGMGPEATALLMRRVIALTRAQDDIDHVPLLVDMNPQIPSRIAALIDGDGPNPGPTLAQMAQNLEAMGSLALAMPCNTAHHHAPYITDAVNTPFLHMLTLSAEIVTKIVGKNGKVGMLASPATDTFNIFQNVFDDFQIEAIYPHDADAVLSIIKQIKAEGPSAEMAVTLSSLGRELKERGAGCLLVGCSEFSLLTTELQSELPIQDTVDILSEAIIDFSGAKRRFPKNHLNIL